MIRIEPGRHPPVMLAADVVAGALLLRDDLRELGARAIGVHGLAVEPPILGSARTPGENLARSGPIASMNAIDGSSRSSSYVDRWASNHALLLLRSRSRKNRKVALPKPVKARHNPTSLQ